jgi:hypothetical protein
MLLHRIKMALTVCDFHDSKDSVDLHLVRKFKLGLKSENTSVGFDGLDRLYDPAS